MGLRFHANVVPPKFLADGYFVIYIILKHFDISWFSMLCTSRQKFWRANNIEHPAHNFVYYSLTQSYVLGKGFVSPSYSTKKSIKREARQCRTASLF